LAELLDHGRVAVGGTAATSILDRHHPRVVEPANAQQIVRSPQRELVRTAHRLIGERVRPVYAMNDERPVSVTVARGRGSCSQWTGRERDRKSGGRRP
jgi:hypothetical protein